MRRRIGAGNKSLKKLVEKKIITSARTKKKIETKPAPNADPTIGLWRAKETLDLDGRLFSAKLGV